MPRLLLFTKRFALWASLLFAAFPAEAKDGLFDVPADSDWALNWLNAVFQGGSAIQGSAYGGERFASLTTALREVLGVYSMGMLVLAGFLLLYHMISIVAETAHTGVVMGKRANRLWAPLRLVLAIGLLVPVGSGLNSGQYLIIKLAAAGSSLASNAWRDIASKTTGSLDGSAIPHRPDTTRLVAISFEMELCRELYRQLFSRFQGDPYFARVGTILELKKIPPGRLAPETWRYSNSLHAETPLCGEYRFLSSFANREKNSDSFVSLSDDLSSFARSNAERLALKTRPLAEKVAFSFFDQSLSSPSYDISGALAGIIQEQKKILESTMQTIAAAKVSAINRKIEEAAAAGWFSAGLFTAGIAQRQSILGSLASQSLPSAHAPVFGHKAMDRRNLLAAVDADPLLRQAPAGQIEKLASFYDQINAAMRRGRSWLYGGILAETPYLLADSLDAVDFISGANDSDTNAFMSARLLKAAAVAYGVWNGESSTIINGGTGLSLTRAFTENPLAGMIELGRRYSALGRYLLSMAGPGLSASTTLGNAVSFVLLGLAFIVAGTAMLFLLPFLPLLRFILAIIAWFLAVFEAVAALPLVAIAHLTPVGEGLSGPLARRSYWLWLSVFMRPSLTLLGFIAGLALLALSLVLLNALFGPILNPMTVAPGEALVPVWAGLAIVYAVLAVAVTNAAFKSINFLPERILDWLKSIGSLDLQAQQDPIQGTAQIVSMSAGPAEMNFVESRTAASRSGMEYGSAAETMGSTPSPAARSPRGLREALIPTYKEPAGEPVSITGKDTAISKETKIGGALSGAAAAAKAAGETAFASATATARADVTVVTQPGEKPAIEEILDAIDPLAMKKQKLAPAIKEDKASMPEKPEKSGKPANPDMSPEQSSAPPQKDGLK